LSSDTRLEALVLDAEGLDVLEELLHDGVHLDRLEEQILLVAACEQRVVEDLLLGHQVRQQVVFQAGEELGTRLLGSRRAALQQLEEPANGLVIVFQLR
jgi:hypothetical protein